MMSVEGLRSKGGGKGNIRGFAPKLSQCFSRVGPIQIGSSKSRVAVKELKLSYYSKETLSFTRCPYYGNLIYISLVTSYKTRW